MSFSLNFVYGVEAESLGIENFDDADEYLDKINAPDEAKTELKYQRAQKLFKDMKYLEAYRLFAELEDYEKSPDMLGICRENCYNLAMIYRENNQINSAVEIFEEIGDYKDSAIYLDYLKRYQTEKHKNILKNKDISTAGDTWFLYSFDDCYVYVPIETNKDTRFGVYFPGGYDGDMLFRDGMYTYCKKYSPNAIIIFFISSGYTSTTKACDRAYDIFKDVAHEKELMVKDIITMGSSMGSFSALHAGAYFFDKYKVFTDAVISLDAGLNWEVDRPLSNDEYDTLKNQGTKLYLFEQYGTGEKHFRGIDKFVERNSPTYIIECANGGHDAITIDGFKYGAMSWAFGEFETLDEVHYHIVELQ